MKKIVLAIGILAAFGVNAQQVDRSIMPAPAKAATINIPDPTIFTLDNGLTVILSENHKIPKVTFNLTVTDKQNLEGGKAGLADMAGSLILGGTASMSKDELDAKSDYIGANLRASESSITLSCLTKFKTEGLKLMTDVLYNANFPESEFNRVKKQMESALLSVKSSPESMGQNALMKTLFANHPYGEVMTEETLGRITREDVVDYYKRTFVPQGSYLVIVGDLTKEEARKIANDYFGSWNGNRTAIPTFMPIPDLKGGNRVIFVKKTGAVQSYIQVARPLNISIGHPDQLSLSVMNGILGGGGFGTRLFQNLREDKGYTYGAYSSVEVESQGSYFNASGSFRTEVTDSAIIELLKEVGGFAKTPASQEELDLTKASMNGRFARSLENASTIARFATTIARYNLPKDYYKEYLKRLQDIDIASVQKIADKYMSDNNCYIIVVGDDSVLEKIKKFDGDGKIELLDAFGNPAKEMVQSDITGEKLFDNYTLAVTKSKTIAERDKKLKKLKTVKIVSDLTIPQAPVKLQMTNFWAAPNHSASSMEMNGMILEKSFFNGTSGYKMNAQTGRTEMTQDEINNEKKSVGYFPEANYAKIRTPYELLGIEDQNGTLLYVVKMVDGDDTTLEYFFKDTYLKAKTVKMGKTPDGEAYETTITYMDYKEVGGILIPHRTSMGIGEMVLSAAVQSVVFNKGSINDFK